MWFIQSFKSLYWPLRLVLNAGRRSVQRLGALLGLGMVRVSGPSMQPHLVDGDYLIFRKSRGHCDADRAIGRAVVVMHPQFGRIVKCAVAGSLQGHIGLRGTSVLSSAPEHLGEVSLDSLEGIGWIRISPTGVSSLGRCF